MAQHVKVERSGASIATGAVGGIVRTVGGGLLGVVLFPVRGLWHALTPRQRVIAGAIIAGSVLAGSVWSDPLLGAALRVAVIGVVWSWADRRIRARRLRRRTRGQLGHVEALAKIHLLHHVVTLMWSILIDEGVHGDVADEHLRRHQFDRQVEIYQQAAVEARRDLYRWGLDRSAAPRVEAFVRDVLAAEGDRERAVPQSGANVVRLVVDNSGVAS